jgi:hypothetical protein
MKTRAFSMSRRVNNESSPEPSTRLKKSTRNKLRKDQNEDENAVEMTRRNGEEDGMARRNGEEEWRGGMARRNGEEEWRGGMARRNGEGGMARRNGETE